MNPECGKIYSASNLVYKTTDNPESNDSSNIDKKHCHRVDDQGLPDMIIAPENAIKFPSTPIPKHFLYPQGSKPDEITQHSIDSSYTLEYLIHEKHQDCQFELLGELQFAFIIFLLGHQFESFEHWEHMIRVICSCRRTLLERPEFFLAFIRVFHFQLKQTDQAIFADIVDNENRVYHWIRTFFLNIRSTTTRSDLMNRADKFRYFLSKTFGWNFGNLDQQRQQQQQDDDDDENVPEDEKPVIVMM